MTKKNTFTNQAGDKNQSSHKGFKMKIEIGSKWVHKDGGVYTILYKKNFRVVKEDIPVVWYKDQQREIYVRTEKHFLKSFKPYKPIYQYLYAWETDDIKKPMITDSFFVDEKELMYGTQKRFCQKLSTPRFYKKRAEMKIEIEPIEKTLGVSEDELQDIKNLLSEIDKYIQPYKFKEIK